MDILFTLIACVLMIIGFVVICRPIGENDEEEEDREP